MQYIAGYRGTCKAIIPLIISYKCSKCNHDNVCAQTITIEGNSQGNRWANQEKLSERAKEDLDYKIKMLFEAVEHKNYRDLKLDCTCTACKQKEAWTEYVQMEGIYDLYGLIFSNSASFMVTLALSVGLLCFNKWLFLAILLLCLIPFIWGIAKNCIIQSKIDKMEKENLPSIHIIKQ